MSPMGQERRHHLLTVVSGYGLRVLPMTPCRVSRGPGPRELDVTLPGRSGRLVADGTGGWLGKIDADLMRVDAGPVDGDWQLETGRFRCAFPAGFELCSVEVHSPSPFDLVGPGGILIFVQSPLPLPSPAQLAEPGRKLTDSGRTWVELAYEHEGAAWWQRHEIVDAMVFTAQAPVAAKDAAASALRDLVKSLTLT